MPTQSVPYDLWGAQRAINSAIGQYLRAQHAKGLVNVATHRPSWGGKGIKVGYETHWGTHQDVILPEVQRLVAEHDFHLNVAIRECNAYEGWKDAPMGPGVDVYVEVALHMWRKE